MLALSRPDVTAEHSFVTCIDKIKSEALRTRLEATTPLIIAAAAEFDTAALQQSQHQIAAHEMVGAYVTKEDMEKLYEWRMVPKGSPGRDIYDKLIAGAAQGRCPLCAHRQVATLDHYLPKAHYPSLAVTPVNLVPACSDCNKAKHNSAPQSAAELWLHPYYDDVDAGRWLFAEVVMTVPAALRYRAEPPAAWDQTLRQRVQNQFARLKLAGLYASQAADELVNIRHQLGVLHGAGGAIAIRTELEERASSCAASRLNGWRTAAYESWAASDWFCDGGFV